MLFARETGWIGVDIGTHSVKLAQVERQGSQYVLTEAVTIQRLEPWSSELGDLPLIHDSAEELVAARTLGEGFVGGKAASALPMAMCELKSLQVPGGAVESRRAAIAAELASNPQSAGRGREFDFWPTDSELENATIVRENVGVLSVPSDRALHLAQDHKRAGLKCLALDGMPLALSRAVSMCSRVDTSRPVGVLDWGFARATFCVVYDRRPLFVRCLRDCEYGAVLRALRDELSLTWDEARRVAVDHAACGAPQVSNDELQTLVSEIVASSMNQLTSELDRTLVYLKMHRGKLLPEQLWLFGGGAAVKGITPWLRERVGLDVQCWDMGESCYCSDSAGESSVAMLGPAIALSALAWEAQ